jgi:hypothetical protein
MFHESLSDVFRAMVGIAIRKLKLGQINILIQILNARINPIRLEDHGLRADKFFRVAMTLQTPRHPQRRMLRNHFHMVDGTMTGGASHSLRNVNTMIEVHKLRKMMHANPGNRLIRTKSVTQRRQHLRIRPHLRMAGHAGLRRRDSRVWRVFNAGVAKAAINAQLLHVVFVAEGNRLFRRNTNTAHIRRAIDRREEAEPAKDD